MYRVIIRNKIMLSVIIGLFITSFINIINVEAIDISSNKKSEIKNELRCHIIANSDSPQDQEMKRKVKDITKKVIEEVIYSNDKKEDASRNIVSIAKENKEEIKNKIIIATKEDLKLSRYIKKNGIEILVKEDKYPMKAIYSDKGLTVVDEDIYSSLEIKIGKARGHNFWQMIYPDMVLPSECISLNNNSKTKNDKKVHVKSKLLDIIKSI